MGLRTFSTEFHRSVALLLQLHHEMSVGDPDGNAADQIRDEMEAPWYAMSDIERELVRGLSADFYTLGESKTTEPNTTVQVPQAISEATSNADWEGLLELLRSCDGTLPSHVVSYLRGVAWFHLGQPIVAKEFLQYAVERASGGLPAYLHYYFYTLIVLGRTIDALPYAENIAARSSDPLLLLDAAEVFFVRSTEVQGKEVDALLQTAREIAERGLKQANNVGQDEVLSLQCGLTYLWMALDNTRSDDVEAAYHSLEMAKRYIPNDPGTILVESWLTPRSGSGSWDRGVGIGLIRLRGTQPAMLNVP